MKQEEKITRAEVGRAIHAAIVLFGPSKREADDYQLVSTSRADVIEYLIWKFCPEAKHDPAVAENLRIKWEQEKP